MHPRAARHGGLSHAFIGRLLTEGKVELAPMELAREVALEVAKQPDVHRAPVPRGAARRALHLAARSYLVHFTPPAGCVLMGTEVQHARVRFDMVWETEARDVWVDELKLRRAGLRRIDVDAQVRRQLTAGAKLWGPRFLGVRVCFLLAPERSFVARADGTTEPSTAFLDHG